MTITMTDSSGDFVTKVCREETWMDVLRITAEGLRGLGYFIPDDRNTFLKMLSDNMEANA